MLHQNSLFSRQSEPIACGLGRANLVWVSVEYEIQSAVDTLYKYTENMDWSSDLRQDH